MRHCSITKPISYHFIEGNWTPYSLQGENTLASVQGASLNIVFEPVEQPLTVNGIPRGLQYCVGNGG